MNRKRNESGISNEYFEWLAEQAGQTVDGPQRDSYWFVLNKLHTLYFVSKIPMDDNRIEDAMVLREEFLSWMGLSIDGDVSRCPIFGEASDSGEVHCTMLELLIALARRFGYLIYDPATGDRIVECFWEMMGNLGLDTLNDEEYYAVNGPNYVDEVHRIVVDRRYDRYGRGGIFPLERPENDQRKVEIWYQLSAYVMEKESF